MASEQKTVKFETLLGGYVAAHSRFKEARLTQDAEATSQPLFEALNWAVVMDDHVRLNWRPEGEILGYSWRDRLDEESGAIVKGIRFARNRVHHQWAHALRLSEGGAQSPFEFPHVFHEWSWISADEIPLGKNDNDNRGIDEYRSTLQGQAARLSLSALDGVYRDMAEKLNVDR